MLVLLAVLNDFPIMMIAYDNVRVAERPVRWEMPRVLAVAVTAGTMGLVFYRPRGKSSADAGLGEGLAVRGGLDQCDRGLS